MTEPYNSCGNGSAMRISAIVDIYDDFYELMQVTQWSAEITHNHPEGIKDAQATAAAAWMAKNNYPKKRNQRLYRINVWL